MGEVLDQEPGVYEIKSDEDIDALVMVWRDDIDGDAYRDGMERLLEHIRRRDVSGLFVDSRAQGPMETEDQDWTVDDFEPRAIEAGLDRVAAVYPADDAAKQTLDMTARKEPFSELDRLFTADPDEARNWLRLS